MIGFDVSLDAGTLFSEALETDHNAFVYVISGELQLEDTDGVQLSLARDQLAVLTRGGDRIELQAADQASRFLLVAGKPLNEPVARGGPFVMNTEAEIQQAFSDYRSGNF